MTSNEKTVQKIVDLMGPERSSKVSHLKYKSIVHQRISRSD